MLADFIFLSADIMKIAEPEVWKVKVTKTILNGEIVFSE
jgi:predicted amidohydrolase YtcJ